mmetsp:Transcript_64342/g.207309  ORF Transcript_64342/g.207309 Transcript_64342/m.207309 type:complete len:220 (+) Transcript_64342:990-1649(+)
MVSVAPGGAPKAKIVGSEKDMIPTKSMVTLMSAAPPENCCSERVRPPTKKDMPNTSNRLERMEPSKLFLTISNNPDLIALMVMIISTALPKVALSRPPMVSLRFSARCSVASPKIFARGTRPRKQRQKTMAPLYSFASAAMPMGAAMKRMLMGSSSRRCRIWALLIGAAGAMPRPGARSTSIIARVAVLSLSERTAFSSGKARFRMFGWLEYSRPDTAS